MRNEIRRNGILLGMGLSEMRYIQLNTIKDNIIIPISIKLQEIKYIENN